MLRTKKKSIFGQIPTMGRLVNEEEVTVEARYEAPAGTPVAVTPVGEIFLAIAAADPAQERERLDKEIARIEQEARTVNAKLQNDAFVQRAPSAGVEDHRRRLNDLNGQLSKLKQAREGLS